MTTFDESAIETQGALRQELGRWRGKLDDAARHVALYESRLHEKE